MDFVRVLPEEVILNNILPYLRINDLLRFRRLCRTARNLADDHMSLRKARSKRVCEVKLRHIVPMGHIDVECFQNAADLNWTGSGDVKVGGNISKLICLKETKAEGTLGYVLELDQLFAMGKVYLNACCMHDLWKNPQMTDFMEMYAAQITQLRLNKVNLPLHVEERKKFLAGFHNLESLEIEVISTLDGTFWDEPWEHIPSNFRNLKALKIQCFLTPAVSSPDNNLRAVRSDYYRRFSRFVKECCITGTLEHLNFPAQIKTQEDGTTVSFNQEFLEVSIDIMKTRENRLPGQPNLSEVDLKNFWFPAPSAAGIVKFLEFGDLCQKLEVKLLNFDQTLTRCLVRFITRPDQIATFSRILKRCVVSVRNLHLLQFGAELPHLQRILITRSSLCSMPWDLRALRPTWEKLTTIHMTIDSKILGGTGLQGVDIPPRLTSALFKFLFDGIQRESLTELKLKFTLPYSVVFTSDVPIIRHICSACPNLKILALDHWTGNSGELGWFWVGLPLLEEVYLANCQSIKIKDFTARHNGEPLFLNLKKLKKLTLDHLENMPKLDSTLFSLVLRHMELRELHLKCDSDKPIKNITVADIKILLTGNFANSIEKFPLAGHLHLDGVPQVDMKKLETEFRSSKMI